MEKIEHYKTLHQTNSSYGAGSRHFYFVFPILVYLHAKSILDYGCGKGVLANQLHSESCFSCDKYDPAVSDYDTMPSGRFDCLINTDVLEHIPEPELHDTLKYFPRLSDNAIVIPHLKKAAQILPSGENAHCTLKAPEQWQEVLIDYYKFVALLPHESDRHALLLCAQENIDVKPLASGLQHIAAIINDRARVHARLDDPFSTRVRRAVKLVLGKRILR